MKKSKKVFLIFALFILIFNSCTKASAPENPEKDSPYITIPCGDEYLQIIPQEGAEVSDFRPINFVMDGQERIYLADDYTTTFGIDVSAHQGKIDWQKVAADGVKYVYIRAGYRGYTQGGLNVDKYFYQNIEGARARGIPVGVYFFSQAINADEAREEAEYLLTLIDGYRLDLPVMFDWERTYDAESRTEEISIAKLTDWCFAFCNVITDAGYDAGIYTNRKLAYEGMDIKRLQDAGFIFWVAQYDWWPDFYYKHDIWQYSFKGHIDGINGTVDMNLEFTPTKK